NQFVAAFVGSPPMNFLDVTCDSKGALCLGDIQLQGPPDVDLRSHGGSLLTLGVRPEDVHLTGGDGVSGIIQVVEQLGASTLLYVKVQKSLIAVQTPGNMHVKVGDPQHIGFAPDRLYLFEGSEGKAIRTPGTG
ncbi:MAG TPA: TOBE domain-containing protein, partial [Aggregatilineales bacterium]|nr:TOBE domain-containing protein [Aggregatilineales bacterium]